jgi:type I restriction enzyme S subunit
MKSNYRILGDYIREVNIRNINLEDLKLLGVSIQKVFMPSIANIIGTDMSTYKLIRKKQFAYGPVTSRNGDKISVALLEDCEQAMISQAYTSFEVIDESQLLPEYLMMWFRRPEFDRYARFMSHGSAREIFGWEEMCNTTLPVPSITHQKEIVKEYNVLMHRIDLNNRFIQKLEETTQAIYNQWFVDFEFPDENGKPYKSSGGKMEFNAELDKEIPQGWEKGTLDDIADIIDGDRGKNYPNQEDMKPSGFCLFLNAGNVSKNGFNFTATTFISKENDESLRKGKLVRNDVVITSRGTVGNVAFYSDVIPFTDIRINSGMLIIRGKENAIFIYSLLRNNEMKKVIENYLSGSAQPQLPIKDLIKIPIIIPSKSSVVSFSQIGIKLQKQIDTLNIQNNKLAEINDVLLSKMATVGDI